MMATRFALLDLKTDVAQDILVRGAGITEGDVPELHGAALRLPSRTLPSVMEAFRSSTSLMRWAETCACGSSMKIITSIMKDMIT